MLVDINLYFQSLFQRSLRQHQKIKRYVHVVETQIVHFCLLSHDLNCPTQPNVINKISSYQKNVYIIQYTYFRRPHILVQYCRSVEIFIRSQYFYLIYSPYNYPRICCIWLFINLLVIKGNQSSYLKWR